MVGQRIVESSGTQFDPDVVDASLEHEEQFLGLATELADTPKVTVRDIAPPPDNGARATPAKVGALVAPESPDAT